MCYSHSPSSPHDPMVSPMVTIRLPLKSLDCFLDRFLFFFFSLFLAAPRHMEFLGQESNPSCSCNLSHSCSKAEFSTHCTGLGIEPVSLCSQDMANSDVPQRELLVNHFHHSKKELYLMSIVHTLTFRLKITLCIP